MRHINEEGRQLIKKFEGFSPVIYLCPAGLKTIGYGHVVKEGENFNEGITQEVAEDLLEKDLLKFRLAVLRLIKQPLNDNQFSALVSFAYNVGAAALQRSTLRRKINSGYIEDVGNEFLKWVYINEKKSRGLLKRRLAEVQLFKRDNLQQ